ncbi:MAG: hypothetical protein U5N85_19860 [Arcicella sp.]|nr:hypothetical protein [Arcicella sp.]
MKKIGIHKKLMMLTAVVGMMLLVTSCGRGYVRSGYGYGRPYGYGYNYPRPYRYAVPPPVVVVPRYCPPPRRGNGRAYGRRRW